MVCVCVCVWCGVVWCGVVWCGVVWCGVWCGVVRCGAVWVFTFSCASALSGEDGFAVTDIGDDQFSADKESHHSTAAADIQLRLQHQLDLLPTIIRHYPLPFLFVAHLRLSCWYRRLHSSLTRCCYFLSFSSLVCTILLLPSI